MQSEKSTSTCSSTAPIARRRDAGPLFPALIALAWSLVTFSNPVSAGNMVSLDPIVGKFQNYTWGICGTNIAVASYRSEAEAIAGALAYVKPFSCDESAQMITDWADLGLPMLGCSAYDPPKSWMGLEGAPVPGGVWYGDIVRSGYSNIRAFDVNYKQISGTSCVPSIYHMEMHRVRNLGCPAGSLPNSTNTACVRASNIADPIKNCGCPASKAENGILGNPCNAATGNKYESETDYSGSGSFPLVFARTYNSLGYDKIFGEKGSLGTQWRSNVLASLKVVTNTVNGVLKTTVTVLRPDGNTIYFSLANGVWMSDSDITDQLAQTASGWTYTTPNGTVETYQNVPGNGSTSYGRLASITNAAGLTQTMSYDALGRLASVTDVFGRSLSFSYDTSARISSLTTPDGRIFSYNYDTNNNLVQASYPDGTAKVYYYEKSAFPNALTGIAYAKVNPDGSLNNVVRYATFDYDATGRAILTQHADIGGGGPQEKFTLTYNSDSWTTVTNATGMQEFLGFTTNLGVKNLTTRKNLTDYKYLSQTFDTNNNLTCQLSEEGRVTTFAYNASNQRISKTEGLSGYCAAPPTAITRTTTYQYLSPTLDLPTVIESPSVYGTSKKRVSITYSGKLPTVITQSGYTPAGTAVARTISLGYNASGQVTNIDGARTDVNDLTTLTYYECSTGGACGQLQRISNALGQFTTFDNYDAAGRLLEMTDANGTKTTYAYDARGRVATIRQTTPGGTARVTQYTYDAAGNVLTASMPTGLLLTYTYNAALYVTRVTDNLGNSVSYSYDLKGNRIAEKTYDPSGTLVRSIDTAYDVRNRVSQLNDGGSITKQVFDAVGNLTKVTDPNTVGANGTAATTNSYDILNRLTNTVDLLAGNTNYTYDVNDRVKSAQAANGATTQYQYDDLGNLVKETSPDRGVTTYTYDTAGNLLSQTDARGITASYSYDALNRLASVSYADVSENVTYSYDSGTGCTYGVGRLCRVQDAAGTSDYGYDALGNVLTHTRTEMGVAYTTRYGYDSGNRVTSITYPNGRVVDYTRDAKGNVFSANASLGGTVSPIITESSHRPDGQLNTRRFGNGLSETRAYSLQGRLREQYLGSADTRLYSYDLNGNLTGEQSLPQVGAYTYDVLNRLSRDQITSTPASDTTYTYDANGNRKTAGTGTYAYLAATNRLTNALGSSIGLDAAGNTTADGSRSYSYHQAGTLSGVTGVSSYRYNAQRQRTRKVMGSDLTLYHYDLAGNLIAETRGDGTLIRDYVWVDGTPVAQVEASGSIAYLHTDHLNTPRLATDSSQQVVWRWEGKAFGDTAASGTVTVNLRFPGQYYDAESGLHYNWNRYYDPKLGRYITSDPVGLEGGLNTYAYVVNSPLRWSDPTGLEAVIPQPIGFPGTGTNPGIWNVCRAGPWGAVACSALGGYAVGSAIYPHVEPAISKAVDSICPSGNKDPCDDLNKVVQEAKKKAAALGGCKGGMSPEDLIARRQAWLDLAIARAKRDTTCWAGGDDPHQKAHADAWSAVGNCSRLLGM